MNQIVPLATQVPALVRSAGEHAQTRFWEFFVSNIRNPNTRRAYGRAIGEFFAWCERQGVASIVDIEPLHETPVLDPSEARALLDSIDVTTQAGLRDRALIGLMVYSFARVGAALSMKVEDVYVQNRRLWVRLHEKGGKRHEMPCHHNLEAYLHAYIDGCGLAGDPKGHLFRTIGRGTEELTLTPPLPQANAYAMIRRRALVAGIATKIGNHSSLAGRTLFGVPNTVLDPLMTVFSALTLTIACLHVFLSDANRADKYRRTAARYAAVKRQIEQLLSKNELSAIADASIDSIRMALDELGAEALPLPKGVWNTTEKKLEAEEKTGTPSRIRPILLNGVP